MHTAAKRLLPIAALLLAGFGANASAQQPAANGLGSSWPNTPDVSLSPRYHVYRFIKDGVIFIQVNDLHGTPLMAVASANGVVLPLPVGKDADRLDTTDTSAVGALGKSSSSSSSATDGETVYKDSRIQVLTAASSEGDTGWKTRAQ